jgi:transposase
MEKEDARYQTWEQLHERRKQVVRLHKQGAKVMRIVKMVGLSYPTVRAVIDLFIEGGWLAIRPAGRGREPGQGRLLSDEQEYLIKRAIIDKRPEQLKLDFYLWSRSAVAQLIEQECSLKLSVRTVGKYLKRWGFTPQKPIKKAYEQRPGAVKAWLDEHYPAIADKAKAEGGEIHWGDETALTNTDARGRGYAPVGKTPVSYVPAGKREKLSMTATSPTRAKPAG